MKRSALGFMLACIVSACFAAGGASDGAKGSRPPPKMWQTSEWTVEDDLLHATYLYLRILDTMQSADCARKPTCSEVGDLNRAVYGSTPSVNEVYKYGLLHAALVTYIAIILDPPYRSIFQGVMIFDELRAVHNNRLVDSETSFGPPAAAVMLGLGVKWRFF